MNNHANGKVANPDDIPVQTPLIKRPRPVPELPEKEEVTLCSCTCKKIAIWSLIVCLSMTVIIVIAGAVYIYSQPDLTRDAEKWKEMLLEDSDVELKVDGTYNLVSYDEKYSEYLKAMGIPFYVVPLILGASEKMEIKMPEDDNDKMVITTVTDWMTRTSEFKFNEEFSVPYGKGSMSGIMQSVCHKENVNDVFCYSEERSKGWNFTSLLQFSRKGMTNTRTFITENIVTKKFYQKEGGENSFLEKDSESGAAPGESLSGIHSEAEDDMDWDLEWSEEDDDWFS